MSTYTDLSGNVRLSAGPTLPSFQESRGMYFDGRNNAFKLPQINLSPDFIIVCWFNPNYNGNYVTIIDKPGILIIGMKTMSPYFYMKGTYFYSSFILSSGT